MSRHPEFRYGWTLRRTALPFAGCLVFCWLARILFSREEPSLTLSGREASEAHRNTCLKELALRNHSTEASSRRGSSCSSCHPAGTPLTGVTKKQHYRVLELYPSKDALRLLGLRHTWMLELSSTTGNGGPLQSPKRPPPGGDISWGAINNCPPLCHIS